MLFATEVAPIERDRFTLGNMQSTVRADYDVFWHAGLCIVVRPFLALSCQKPSDEDQDCYQQKKLHHMSSAIQSLFMPFRCSARSTD